MDGNKIQTVPFNSTRVAHLKAKSRKQRSSKISRRLDADFHLCHVGLKFLSLFSNMRLGKRDQTDEIFSQNPSDNFFARLLACEVQLHGMKC